MWTFVQIFRCLCYVALKTSFFMKDINWDTVFTSSHPVKCLVILHVWQLWHVLTLERDRSEICHFRRSFHHWHAVFPLFSGCKLKVVHLIVLALELINSDRNVHVKTIKHYLWRSFCCKIVCFRTNQKFRTVFITFLKNLH